MEREKGTFVSRLPVENTLMFIHTHKERTPPKKACVCVWRKVIFTKDRERGKLTQTKREKKRRVGDRAERERQESRRILLWIDTKWKDFC